MQTHEWEGQGTVVFYGLVIVVAVVIDLIGIFFFQWPVWKAVVLPPVLLAVTILAVTRRRERGGKK